MAITYDAKSEPDIQDFQSFAKVFVVRTQLIDRRLHFALTHLISACVMEVLSELTDSPLPSHHDADILVVANLHKTHFLALLVLRVSQLGRQKRV